MPRLRGVESAPPGKRGHDKEPLVILATPIPRELRRRVRVVCVEAGREMKDFIAEAIEKKLLREKRRGRRAPSG